MAIGVDIEDINRFEGKSKAFLDRIFTKSEQEYCFSKANPPSHLAVRFCAKEAVIKALTALNLKSPRFCEIEVYHDENKFPKIKLNKIEDYHDLTIDVSLSHDKTKAIAFVLINKNQC